jgi:hypothetical protein
MSVEECQRKISSAEFAEWIAYERISPTDPERQDLRIALLCFHLVHLLGDTKGKNFKITDFLLDFDGTRVALTDEEKRERSRNFWRAIKNG